MHGGAPRRPHVGASDLQLESLAHGVIDLEQLAPEYGAERRRLRVKKLRGVKFRGGYHDFKIATGGLVVYPRLVAADYTDTFTPGAVPSGIPELDELLGGGLERGSSTLIWGRRGPGRRRSPLTYHAGRGGAGRDGGLLQLRRGPGHAVRARAGPGMDLEGADQGRADRSSSS